MKLTHRTVLITGGKSGLGLELSRQLLQRGNTVVELAPPGVETPLLRNEFAEEMKGQKAMDAKVLVARAMAGIEAGKLEIRPGLSNGLKIASRVAPRLMLAQMAKMGRPKPRSA